MTDRGEGHQNQDATQQAPWSKVAAVTSRVDAVPTWGRVAPRTHDVNACPCGARQSLVCVVEGCIAQHRASHGGLLVERERKRACVATRALLFGLCGGRSSLSPAPKHDPARRGSPFETRSTIRARSAVRQHMRHPHPAHSLPHHPFLHIIPKDVEAQFACCARVRTNTKGARALCPDGTKYKEDRARKLAADDHAAATGLGSRAFSRSSPPTPGPSAKISVASTPLEKSSSFASAPVP